MNIFDLKEIIIDFFKKKNFFYKMSKCIDVRIIYDTK